MNINNERSGNYCVKENTARNYWKRHVGCRESTDAYVFERGRKGPLRGIPPSTKYIKGRSDGVAASIEVEKQAWNGRTSHGETAKETQTVTKDHTIVEVTRIRA